MPAEYLLFPVRWGNISRQGLRGVVKEYPGGVQALRGVSVEIPAGDQVAVVGPSGSGKTTMLTVLGTLERPTSGAVEGAGRDAPYIASLMRDGRRFDKPWLSAPFVLGGGRLDYVLAASPSKDWGASAAQAPPSFGPQ